MRRSGLQVSTPDGGDNPVYFVRYRDDRRPIPCFSKIYNDSPNPREGFVALLCCSDVDENCPVIAGASARISWHYDDPKVADDTDDEQRIYDERCRQISTEMFYFAELLSR